MTAVPDWSNVSTPKDFLKMPNNSTSGYFWTGIDIMIFIVIFITLASGVTWEAALIASSFAAILISLFLVYLGLVSFWIMGLFIALILLMFIYVIWSNRYD